MDYDIVELIDMHGNAVPEMNSEVLAKSLKNVETGDIRYLIKMFNGNLLDPNNYNIKSKLIKEKAKFKKVTAETYNLYVIFLRKHSISALRQAQRCV
jgi:hypothetical protein